MLYKALEISIKRIILEPDKDTITRKTSCIASPIILSILKPVIMNIRSKTAIAVIIMFYAANTAFSQNINDTIFVSTGNLTWLRFDSAPKGKILEDGKNFDIRPDGKSLKLFPLRANTKQTTLTIQEGGRTHQFIVAYKDSMNPLEATYDFTNLHNKTVGSLADNNNKTEDSITLNPGVERTNSHSKKSTTKNNASGIEEAYLDAMTRGNTELMNRNYGVALMNYEEARNVKPSDVSVTRQIQFVRDLITKDSLAEAQRKRSEEIKRSEAERLRIFNLGMAAYDSYEKAAALGNFEDQVLNLKEFLRLIDVKDINPYTAGATYKIGFAKNKIKQITNYLTRIKGPTYQLESIPYFEEELKQKYPGINFSAPPPEQVINTDTSTEVIAVSKQVLTGTGNFQLSDSVSNIKLTCQSIIKSGKYLYLKLNIINKDTSDFLTGTMQLGVDKNKKGQLLLNPVYITSFPIVLPGKEFSIVYVAEDYQTNEKENLFFELTNRFKNLRLKVLISNKVLKPA